MAVFFNKITNKLNLWSILVQTLPFCSQTFTLTSILKSYTGIDEIVYRIDQIVYQIVHQYWKRTLVSFHSFHRYQYTISPIPVYDFNNTGIQFHQHQNTISGFRYMISSGIQFRQCQFAISSMLAYNFAYIGIWFGQY